MVLQVTIYRVADGMPLTGSTDIDRRPEVKYCQKYLKLISRKLYCLPDRCVAHLEGFHIYFITADSLSYLALCEDSYSVVLAFCFLQEVQREFLSTYEISRVNQTKRPYELIAFEMYLQKTKQRYSNTRGLSTKLNLADMSAELRLHPPYILQDSEMGLVDKTVLKSFKDTYRPTVVPDRRLLPVGWISMISIFLNLLCMALNITRGMTIINHGHYDAEDQGAYTFGGVFMGAGLICVYQVYLIFYYSGWRKFKTFLCLCLLCWSVYFLEQFRNEYQLAFHVSVAVFSSLVILSRRTTDKLPGYSV